MDYSTTPSALTDMWDKYNQVRVAGDKKTANKLLTDFIGSLKQQDEKDIELFVENICGLTFDTNDKIISTNGTEVSDSDIRIQHPLFKEIILPILKEQYKKGSAKHIKWIGQFEQFFYTDYATTQAFLKESNFTEYFEARHFFEKSYAIDANQKTLILLLNRMAKDINYYTHEVPRGVLVVPEVLTEELITFRKYWEQSDTKNNWKADLTAWDLISKHWSLYFADKDNYDNFEVYLTIHGIELD